MVHMGFKAFVNQNRNGVVINSHITDRYKTPLVLNVPIVVDYAVHGNG